MYPLTLPISLGDPGEVRSLDHAEHARDGHVARGGIGVLGQTEDGGGRVGRVCELDGGVGAAEGELEDCDQL